MGYKSFSQAFLPNQEKISVHPLKFQRQLPFVAIAYSGFILTTILLAVMVFLKGLFISGIAYLLPIVIFVTSIVLLKKARFTSSVYLGTIGLIALSVVTLFSGDYQEDIFEIYRVLSIILVLTICNQVIALKKRQVFIFFIGSTLLWIVGVFKFKPLFQVNMRETLLTYLIGCLGIIAANGILFLVQFFNSIIIEVAEESQKKAEATLEKVTVVLDESQAGFAIGQKLISETTTATQNVQNIENLYAYLISETDNLNSETKKITKASKQVMDNANNMTNSVQNQNAAITETSAAVTQISANLNNISDIASRRRTSMDNVIQGLTEQQTLISTLLTEVSQVQESSDGIVGFVSTVDDIASQTGLLAMNASIEAAHAGSSGKGFAVIAQEIRKLSEETAKNAARISEVLKQNAVIVSQTASSVNEFAQMNSKNTIEMKSTIEAIEEILAGISEMNIGTQEVMKALQEIVDESHSTKDMVDEVTSEINEQGDAIKTVSEIANTLEKKVAELKASLINITTVMTNIDKVATDNVTVAKNISSALEKVTN